MGLFASGTGGRGAVSTRAAVGARHNGDRVVEWEMETEGSGHRLERTRGKMKDAARWQVVEEQ